MEPVSGRTVYVHNELLLFTILAQPNPKTEKKIMYILLIFLGISCKFILNSKVIIYKK